MLDIFTLWLVSAALAWLYMHIRDQEDPYSEKHWA